MSQKIKSEIMGISRLRMGTDGNGISTLVAFYGCPLSCRYCLNPQCNEEKTRRTNITPEHLVEILSVDQIYFKSTGGGVVFGGGEPLLQSEYIKEVCQKIANRWEKRVETSLNVSWDKIEILIPYIDQWIIDIKDSHQDIYHKYTGKNGDIVYANVENLSKKVGRDKLVIRIPEIPEYNTEEDVLMSMQIYEDFGKIDLFQYQKIF